VSAELEALEADLGHRFRNRELLQRALTHRSSAYERNTAGGAATDNEQLEFLGDSILGFIVSDTLVMRHPAYPEGRLSKLKAHLVSSSHLHEVAMQLKLGDYLFLGRGEELSGGREKKALLSNAVEALIAAVYLDGGFESARQFVVQHILGAEPPSDEGVHITDYKGALQEMAQALKLPQPRYSIIEERGPEHSKTFLVEVRVGRDWVSSGEGLSKKSAGQKAAQKVLQQLTEWGR
jgi:ribonuclease III